jgi:hypothetical protein
VFLAFGKCSSAFSIPLVEILKRDRKHVSVCVSERERVNNYAQKCFVLIYDYNGIVNKYFVLIYDYNGI